jgi:CBS domain-containing protein
LALLAGLGSGSAALYFLDPAVGRRRRARMRDRLAHALRLAGRDVHKVEAHATNRARGLLARARAALQPRPVSDEVVEERVRSAIGRVCSHAGAIEVSAMNCAVTLSGPILEREHHRVLREVSHVRGVRAVTDRLDPHVAPDHVPGLQGDGHPPVPAQMHLCADLMKRDVQFVRETDAVQTAVEQMTLRNIGFLPVCDEARHVLGTITDRDVVVRVVARGLAPDTCPVSQAMTRRVVACRPHDELEVAEQLMAQNQVARLVITDESGVLRGVISLSDIVENEPARRALRTLRAVAAREAARSS